MKMCLSILIVCTASLGMSQSQVIQNQNAQFTQRVNGAGIGLLGVWVFKEHPLSKNMALQGEVGYSGGLFGSSSGFDYVATTTLELEPKIYYNFKRRQKKGKNFSANAANFISLSAMYVPDVFTKSSVGRVQAVKTFILVPKYGFRRVFLKRMAFDFGFGVGKYWDEFGYSETTAALDLKLFYLF